MTAILSDVTIVSTGLILSHCGCEVNVLSRQNQSDTYVPILFTGSPTFGMDGSNLILLAAGQSSIKLYSYIISVGITAFIHVKSQKYTGNIWAGALINSLIICMITVANCNTITPF